jgi:UDP-2-acetamido-3-amino-2,3-dideoxy-glucuronate N-acetyltransferase
MTNYFNHETAIIDSGAQIGAGTKVWHFAHVFAGAVIGNACSFGQNTMVSDGVVIGSNVKVQNNVAIYSGTTIEDDVFLGPSCVLTNISNPRSQVVRRGIYERTLLRRGATVGANATIVCGITLGRYCFIAAGAVVTKDVPDYALITGVPGKQVGWMSRHGHRLKFTGDDNAVCSESGYRYALDQSGTSPVVSCLDLDEESSLPEDLSKGIKSYREFQS